MHYTLAKKRNSDKVIKKRTADNFGAVIPTVVAQQPDRQQREGGN
jgi:hypothetical protein